MADGELLMESHKQDEILTEKNCNNKFKTNSNVRDGTGDGTSDGKSRDLVTPRSRVHSPPPPVDSPPTQGSVRCIKIWAATPTSQKRTSG